MEAAVFSFRTNQTFMQQKFHSNQRNKHWLYDMLKYR